MGESIYRFALRELPGMRRAWALESQRLAVARLPALEPAQRHAAVLRGQRRAAAQADLPPSGPAMIVFLAIHNAVAWWQLTSANYVEHATACCAREAGQVYEPQPAALVEYHTW